MLLPDDMIGAIKIKDGLFIGDEFAAQVTTPLLLLNPFLGPGIRHGKQGHSRDQLCGAASPQSLGTDRRRLFEVQLA